MPDVSDDLLAAAAQAVAHYGLRKASLTDVATLAGVSRATAYRAFGDRDAMLREVGRYEVTLFLQEFEARHSDGADPRKVVHEFMEHALDWSANHPILARALVTESDLLVGLMIDPHDQSSLLGWVTDQLADVLVRLGQEKAFAVPARAAAEAMVRITWTMITLPSTTFASRDQVLDTMLYGIAGPRPETTSRTSRKSRPKR